MVTVIIIAVTCLVSILQAIAFFANVNAYITGAGGTAISGYNWSATENSSTRGWLARSEYWYDGTKTLYYKVRPVLAF